MGDNEFQNKFWAKFPNSWVNTEHTGNMHTMRMSFDMIDPNLTFAEKDKLAIAIWRDGSVIKDDSGTFLPVVAPTVKQAHQGYPGGGQSYTPQFFASSGPNTITLPATSNGIKWTIVRDSNLKKCQCGSESVGSTKHSSYCEMFSG